MALFTVNLTDVERELLEAHRVRMGLRSQSDVIRSWIGGAPVLEVREAARLDRVVPSAIGSVRVSRVPDLQVGPSAPKPGSRLKG